MLKQNFLLKSFQNCFFLKKDKKKVIKIFNKVVDENNEIIKSLSSKYKNIYKKKQLLRYKTKFKNYRIIGIGGSILGTKAIYSFLKQFFHSSIILKLSFLEIKSRKIILLIAS